MRTDAARDERDHEQGRERRELRRVGSGSDEKGSCCRLYAPTGSTSVQLVSGEGFEMRAGRESSNRRVRPSSTSTHRQGSQEACTQITFIDQPSKTRADEHSGLAPSASSTGASQGRSGLALRRYEISGGEVGHASEHLAKSDREAVRIRFRCQDSSGCSWRAGSRPHGRVSAQRFQWRAPALWTFLTTARTRRSAMRSIRCRCLARSL